MFRQMVMFALLWCFTSADWASYKRAFNKIYGPKEDVFRRRLFESQSKNMNAHNALYDQKLTTHRKFLTKFSDMTVEEIPKSRGAFAVNKTRFPVIDEPLNAELYQVPLPRAVDYREDPCMSRVKDQNGRGPCVETCWSFSVSGLLEYYYCKHTGRIFEFSEKYLVDCVGGESGCRSGHIDKAMEFLIARKKIASEASYPYNTDEQPCRQIEDGYDLSSLVSYDHGSGDQYLMRTLAYKGPVAVTMWAPSKGFDTFRPTDEDDIFESPECEGVKKTNHAVLVVGYGTNKNGDYWIVKNSWGKYWALDGYVKIRRGENYCNIADFIMTPNFV